ncbi:MAG: hypothetical protein KDI75_08110 [Xanthomonadales bacterium]|nr:hypothetical protein [Xanthomonadales bacterium]
MLLIGCGSASQSQAAKGGAAEDALTTVAMARDRHAGVGTELADADAGADEAGVDEAVARPDPALTEDARHYPVDYRVRFLPDEGAAAVTIALGRGSGHLSRLDFHMPASRYRAIEGDGKVERNGDRLVWAPPRNGGELRYRYRIDHERGSGGYDARITDDWALLRGDDLVPSARTRGTRDTYAQATLHFDDLPEGWSAETPWKPAHGGGDAVVNPDTRFDRPTGWILAGRLGVRRESVEGMAVSVAAPIDHAARRLDVLGATNALGIELQRVFGRLPPKLLIVLAPDPMWRGGLSAPRSLYLHEHRPLISENGSSTLVHELVHVVSGIRGVKGEDWIAEGIAEYYSIELMSRIGLLSEDRRQRALEWMKNHGRRVKTLVADSSSGKRTARAVTLLAALDREIRESGDEDASLDDVVRQLASSGGKASLAELRELTADLIGKPSTVLQQAVVE